jgi:membrane-bound lytic murein transglycosylase A
MKTRLLILIPLLALLTGIYLWYVNRNDLPLQTISFHQLPGWKEADTRTSLQAFKISCKILLKKKPDSPAGSPYIPLSAKDWYPACLAAFQVNASSSAETKKFFEQWFKPVEFFNHKPAQGLFTGYYMPLVHGSLIKTDRYHVPVYTKPDDLVIVDLGMFDKGLSNRHLFGRLEKGRLLPYFTRKQINQGAISKSAPVVVWLENDIDRFFLEIEGSGLVALPDGSTILLGYTAQNGKPYTAIAHVLIEKGVMTRENASMQGIREYLESHPEESEQIMNQNQSFVFFVKLPGHSAKGVQKIDLTPGYSLAIDRQWIPIGTPVWLDTTRPDTQDQTQHKLQRLMIAQDVGGAIRGMVRGDVFWGAGEKATEIAGKMKNPGYYWLLLPIGF